MARKTQKSPAKPPESILAYHVYIGRAGKGPLHFLDSHVRGTVQNGSNLQEITVVDLGRPFRIHVPSSPGHGTYGLVIEGMTGTNAEPWSPSQVLAAARFGMFGFRIVQQPGETMAPKGSRGESRAGP